MFIHWGVYTIPAGEWNGKPVAGRGIDAGDGTAGDRFRKAHRSSRPMCETVGHAFAVLAFMKLSELFTEYGVVSVGERSLTVAALISAARVSKRSAGITDFRNHVLSGTDALIHA
jgi:hypothetical protein